MLTFLDAKNAVTPLTQAQKNMLIDVVKQERYVFYNLMLVKMVPSLLLLIFLYQNFDF